MGGIRKESSSSSAGPRGVTRDLQATEKLVTDNAIFNGAYGDEALLSDLLRMGGSSGGMSGSGDSMGMGSSGDSMGGMGGMDGGSGKNQIILSNEPDV